MKRILISTLTCILAGTVLAGCGATKGVEEGSSSGKKEVSFLYIWPEHQGIMEETIAMFEEKNPDIDVVPSIVPWNEAVKTIQTTHASGSPYDVVISGSHKSAEWNAMGVALDISPYVDDKWIETVKGGAYDLGVVDGGLYSAPFRATATLLMYNKDLVPNAPTSMEEFENVMDDLISKGVKPMAVPGNPNAFQLRSILSIFANYDLLEDGILFSDEYRKGYKYDIGSYIEKAGDRMRVWFDKGYISKDQLAMKREEAQAEFFKGNAGFTFINNNELLAHEQMAEDTEVNIGFMGYPKPENATETLVHVLSADSLMVSSKTKVPEEAVAFIEYLTSKEVQELWAKETLSIMGNNTVEYENENQKTIADIINSGKSTRQVVIYPTGSLDEDEGKLISEFISTPSMTSKELGDRFQTQRKKIYEENNK